MSQDTSTNPVLINPFFNPTAGKSRERSANLPDVAVESYADRLMNDLFEDVENLLDRGHTSPVAPEPVLSPAESVEPASPIAEPIASPSLPLSFNPLPRPDPVYSASERVLADMALREVPQPEEMEPRSPRQRHSQSQKSYDRLLLGIGCASIIVTLAVWLISQETKQPTAPPIAQAPAADLNPNQQNQQFADYLQRSLRNIDQQTRPSGAAIAQTPTPTSANTTLPTVVVSKTKTPTSVRTPTGLARVFVPTAIPPISSKGTAPVAVRPIMPPTAPSSQLSGSPVLPSSPALSYALKGLMDSGDDSAALIEINGVTQRYRLGESIGSSGWTLVEVAKNQAIIRRNGEVRSIFVGQTF